ncbi:MAG: acetolactate synthase small subunit [Acidimicrobiales bacterium]
MESQSLPGADLRHHTLVVLVENKAGVLARVSGLFARRGYNIYSLAVAPTDDERFSRITVVVDVESASLEQITKQLFKLVNVVKISELDPRDAVDRELMLATVRADATGRSQVIELVGLFDGRIVDVGHDELTVSLDGEPGRLDDLEDLLRPFGIVELQRTGRVALPKLEHLAPNLRPVRRPA